MFFDKENLKQALLSVGPVMNMNGIIAVLMELFNKPVDMILHCPRCNEQHIDLPEECEDEGCPHYGTPHSHPGMWMNPHHRSHKCEGCGFIWRPADVCTNGVLTIGSRGELDDHMWSSNYFKPQQKEEKNAGPDAHT